MGSCREICAGKPAREIALTYMAVAMSEITAVPAVVKKNGSPQGCGTLSLLPEAAISLTA